MEIVSKPDMRSAEEAGAYLRKLRSILRYLGTCDGNMEEGSLRADVNVSVRRPGEALGTRTETKNVNSVRFVQQAIESEARRQIGVLEDGGAIDQETRLFDPNSGRTRAMRSKEDAHDYRYFPDPGPFALGAGPGLGGSAEGGPAGVARRAEGALRGETTGCRPTMPPCWWRSARRPGFSRLWWSGEGTKRDPKIVSNWITGEFFAALNRAGLELADAPVDAQGLGGLIDLIADGTISGPHRQGGLRGHVGQREACC